MILEATPLKDGNRKELRVLHDTMQQHVRALKSLGYEPSGPFITSAIELKLDETTMFEWQSHSQKCTGVPVPHYNDLLEFLNLRAQATEAHSSDRVPKKSHKPEVNSVKRSSGFIGAHAASVESWLSTKCSLCDADKHPLYACPKFKSLPHESKLSVLKSNKLCSNCLSGCLSARHRIHGSTNYRPPFCYFFWHHTQRTLLFTACIVCIDLYRKVSDGKGANHGRSLTKTTTATVVTN